MFDSSNSAPEDKASPLQLAFAAGKIKAHAQTIKDLASLHAKAAILTDPEGFAGTEEELSDLSLWARTATTKAATSVSPTGAAVLPKCVVADADLPRVENWRKILREIGRAHGDWSARGTQGRVADLLYDVCFLHHRSTSGRWNANLSRWERFGVRSVEGWRRDIPERTFHRLKDRLIADGLIEAHSHLWRGRTHLWVKPTDQLSRILFEDGRWDAVRETYAPKVQKPKPPKSPNKPRGLSARHAAIEAELMALYRATVATSGTGLDTEQAWGIWHRLTKPIKLSAKHTKTAFAPKGSRRYARLYEALGLGWQ
ncbi:hypothetical protein [Aliihoeflea sp. 2WW]|uniref:hypothetical protein n=1 Tax=Aliihoeflea sp. 2WW TaxID=1381123 RepID=UPI0004670DAE|nr:hypothetical protein [Aliihoeflea sp. 2WW]